MKVLSTLCPACNNQLNVKSLICEQCETDGESTVGFDVK